MAGDLAYQEERRDELIGGQIVMMASPSLDHDRVSKNLSFLFENYLWHKTCEYFPDGVDLFLTNEDRFVPDGMLVCDPNISKWDSIHGAPDLVVEILSPAPQGGTGSIKRRSMRSVERGNTGS